MDATLFLLCLIAALIFAGLFLLLCLKAWVGPIPVIQFFIGIIAIPSIVIALALYFGIQYLQGLF